MTLRTIERVGVIGLGKMGGELARHLAAGGFKVAGCDVRVEAVGAVERHGVEGAATPAALAAECDLVIIGVGFDSEVETALFGADGVIGAVRAGTVVAVASTVAPATMHGIAERAASSGAHLLDIPMCRGEQAAKDGRLLIMGGGEAEVFEACRKAFQTFSDSIHYLGPLGAGQVGKLVNNMILWACISANYEGFKLARRLGVDPGPLKEALLDSSAQNWAMASGAADSPMPWAEKDMTIVLKEADAARVSLPLSGTVKEVIKGIKIELGDPMPKEW